MKNKTETPSVIGSGAALFMEMGTGKTKVVIDIAHILHRAGVVKTVLVLAPLSIVDTWCGDGGELSTHAGPASLWGAIVGSRGQKIKAIDAIYRGPDDKLKWYVANIETIITLGDVLQGLRPDIVVVDESTVIKSRTAERSKAITKLFPHTLHKIILSGNPVPKGPHEIFSQYRFADPGIYGTRFKSFSSKYFNLDKYDRVTSFIGLETQEEYQRKFHSIAFIVRKDDCLDLPPKVYETIRVPLSVKHKALYREMYQDAIASYDDETCVAEVVITKMLRCSQIAGGFFPYIVEGDMIGGKIKTKAKVKPILPNPKLQALMQIIDGTSEQVIIWARFHSEIEAIEAALKKAKVSCGVFYGKTSYKGRIALRKRFKAKEVRVFIANPATGSKGLNDLVGANTVIFYSNDYSAENRQQAEDRTHRSGTKGSKVTYIDLVSVGTVDAAVLGVLRANKDFSDALLKRSLTFK